MTEEQHQAQKLTYAGSNLWYCVATLHGEGATEASANRIAWNRWVATNLGSEPPELFTERIPANERLVYSDAEKSDFCRLLASRLGVQDQAFPEFPLKFDLSQTLFDKDLHCEGFFFPKTVNFGSAVFHRDVRFVRSTFFSLAIFSSATFSGSAEFEFATFSRAAVFKSAVFSTVSTFRGAAFSLADFTSVVFSHAVSFESARFSFRVSFSAVAFPDRTSFHSTSFGKAHFESAVFSGTAGFHYAKFSGDAHFDSTSFSKYAQFESAVFSGNAHFERALFSKSINFLNCKFFSRTRFEGAVFETEPPDFRGALLHEATEFHNVKWPKIPRDKEVAQWHVYRYERLKLEMDRLKKHEDEQAFFVREFRSRRQLYPWYSPIWALSIGYDFFGGFGLSVIKPLAGLVLLWAISTMFFALHSGTTGRIFSWREAANFSFASGFSFLSMSRRFFNETYLGQMSEFQQAMSIFDAIVAGVLLFLFILAVRNKFRMK